MRQQTSAIVRLQSLPPVFRGADLTVRFQWTSKAASQYLYLWKRRGLVRGLGGHSDVYANLLMDPNPNWAKALLAAMPSAIVVGVEALRQAGWTTQVPHRPAVAINAKQPVFNIDPYEVMERDSKWFEAASAGIVGERADGLPVLKPAWALADMLQDQSWGDCGLWPDDIEWSEITAQDEQDWQTACRAFDLPQTKLQDSAQDPRSHFAR
ncbi:MAG: hypothetical protein KJ614_06610 [Gammaproteobacteria bacterium]|uniref:hypothetical protein n=1 Tax=Rhodoferax sp. TaxID=50421 RepID=UPI00184F21DA|nr:hypothetical protein [Rhodoferax sp.]MBU3898589.1 hypothetical protein [Gammaproteobacteria bacterium]MBA3057415.1 hypothetical protein [Rhodoferax sp.]MBU3997692.1 hypothetical protein [Gammaproteobacteria bacterium]MBU4019498.1 hypothetical protein [Gammaproteobacteria bacterium]MBU4079012.1 hypothetical protein [Gammaproteobacteria bacterium]